MTRVAIALSSFAKGTALAIALIAGPLAAQDNTNVRHRDPSMRDIAVTPIQDLNLAKDEIPGVLLRAESTPYVTDGLDSCRDLERAIAELDAVLGADLDIDTGERRDITVGKVAKSAVGSLIPFRGIIREITGAADHQRDFEEAILAGAVRRGFLKGLGQQRGCAYPARPAFTKVEVTKADQIGSEAGEQPAENPAENGEARTENGTRFVSEPVVQETHE